MDTDISLDDLTITLQRYRDLWKLPENYPEYYRRQDNFWSYLFDHFFLKLSHKVDKYIDTPDFFPELKKAITNCHTDYCKTIATSKLNIWWGTRDYKITNFYNVIYFEIFIAKLLKYLQEAFIQGDKSIRDTLIQNKFFCYSHQVDLFDGEQKHKHYRSWWLDFEKRKQDFLKEKPYLIELDIEWYYDNIDHKTLVILLKKFFNRYSNFWGIEEFLFHFNEALFKANAYHKKWIPQGLIGSDILSTIYIWLILIENKNRLWVSMKDWVISFDKTKLIHYSDDFIFFGTSKEGILRFSYEIKSLFLEYWLNIRAKNSAWLPMASGNYNKFDIDIEKIISWDESEVKKMLLICLDQISKDFEKIELEILKRYFKWIRKIDCLNEDDRKKFRISFKKVLFYTQKNSEKYVRAKKFFLLQVISIKDFLYLLKILLTNNEIKEKNIIDFYEQYWYLLASGTRFLLIKAITGKKFFNFLYKKVKINWVDSEIWVFLENKKLLKKELKRQQLDWLNELLYEPQLNNFNENILGIKLSSLFELNRFDAKELGKYIFLEEDIELKKYLVEEARKMNFILDNLILLKNIHPHFYLQDASFLADLYSLFNIVLSFWLSIKEWKKMEVNISWWWLSNLWKIIVNEKEEFLDKINQKVSDTKYTLFYITKRRAELNHKERNTGGWWSNVNVFLRYKQNDHFAYSIKDSLGVYFSLINKEISLKD